VEPSQNADISLVGTNTPLNWKYDPALGLIITTPRDLLDKIPEAGRLAFTFQIEMK
jgi:hypothetical protein